MVNFTPVNAKIYLKFNLYYLWLLLLTLLPLFSQAQFIRKGDAVKISEKCFKITEDRLNRYGSIWWQNKIDLQQPFELNFILYLGMDKYFNPLQNPGTIFYFSQHYYLKKMYQAAQKGNIGDYSGHAVRISHDKSTLNAYMLAPYKNKKYWLNNKYKFSESFIEIIEKNSIPDLSKHIVYKEAATPHTLHRYTLNYKGASYGWAGTPAQFAVPGFRKPSFVQNLYLTGHWTTLGVGISGAAYVGYDTAQIILRKEKDLR